MGSSPRPLIVPRNQLSTPFLPLERLLALRNTPLGEQDPPEETTTFSSIYGCKALEGLRTLTARSQTEDTGTTALPSW